jgi:hypothetical protein
MKHCFLQGSAKLVAHKRNPCLPTTAEIVRQLISVIMKHFLQATAEVLLQEAVDDLMDEAHARQEEYYKKHDVSSQDDEVRGRIWLQETRPALSFSRQYCRVNTFFFAC